MITRGTQSLLSILVTSLLPQQLANASSTSRSTPSSRKSQPGSVQKNVELNAAQMIQSAAEDLRNGEFEKSEKKLTESRTLTADPMITSVWNALMSELKEAQGHWADAGLFATRALKEHIAGVSPTESRGNNGFGTVASRELVGRSMRNFLLAGLPAEAFTQFDKFRNEFYREFLTSSESLMLKRLADELRRIDRSADAVSVERAVFRFYPFISKHVFEALTPDTICRLDEEIQAVADARARGTQLIQRFGSRPDVMGYAQSLAGVASALRLSRQNPDSLSGKVRSELLDTVEWLQSVRDYQTALEITSNLATSQNFDPPFTKERFLMVHARNLNGVHKPVEAAELYRNVILRFPETELANTARPRYVLSLHYAGRYEDVAREASSLEGLVRPRDVLWRTFWARYLNKQFSLALNTTAQETGQDQRARFQYWRGRAHERDGRPREAKEIFSRIASIDGSNHYALFAAWQMQPAAVQPASIQRGNVAFAARKLNVVFDDKKFISMLRTQPKFDTRFAPFAALNNAGFSEVFRPPLRRKLQSLSASGGSLAELLVDSGDAHASVQFGLNQRKSVMKIPIGKDTEWKTFLEKNSASLSLLYPVPYRESIADAAEAFKLSPWLILSIMRAESLFQPRVVSNVGARGLMQIMPSTGERIAEFVGYPDFEPSHLDQPKVSIAFGAWYLARLMDYYSGQLPLAIAAYNAGPEAIDRWLRRNGSMTLDEFLEDIPFEQTRKYVATVLTNMEIYTRLHSKGMAGVQVNLLAKLPTPRNEMEMF